MTTDDLVRPDQHPGAVAAVTVAWRSAARVFPAVAIVAPAVALSAFLLFSVEPLMGRLALPVFGGTPGVWATTLAFFQGLLLLGYLYGHISVTRLGLRRGALVHVVVIAVAFVALVLAPGRVGDLRNEALPAVVDVLLILVVVIGPAAFVLTATTPLVSAWYAAIARSRGKEADPYWLYALSNGGSFAALLAYPFLVEPAIGLAGQRAIWAAGFAVLGLLLAAAAILVRTAVGVAPGARVSEVAATAGSPDAATDSGRAISSRRRIRWVLLAAIPSGLLTAVTNIIATDLVSAPLLWVGPLAIYLLTFVVAFSERGRRLVPRARALAPVAITLLWVPFGSAAGWPILPLLLIEYGGLAVVALALHGRLASDRPAVDRLTEFYLLLALGGAIGGAFVAIVAPVAFKGIWEYPILLVAALAILAWEAQGGEDGAPAPPSRPPAPGPRRLDFRPFFDGAPRRLVPYLVVAVPLALALAATHSLGLEAGLRWILVGGLLLLVGSKPAFLAATTALVLAIGLFVIPRDVVFQDRSFFGVTEVVRAPGGSVTELMNGTTLHGSQPSDPALRRLPTGYYVRSSPVGDVFGALDVGATAASRSIGIIGLGAGALATYERPGDSMTFYEIDPVVVRVALDPAFFTFLVDAPNHPTVVVGDARLSLGRVPAAAHDVLVLDAFSSDTIPVHLLTAEAFSEYARVMQPGGLLAIHVSNRYYDLAVPVASAARSIGLTPLVRSYIPTEQEQQAGAKPSIWVVATADADLLSGFRSRGWQPVASEDGPFTDDFANLLKYMRLAP